MRHPLLAIGCLLAATFTGPAFGQSIPVRDSFETQMDLVARFYQEKPAGLFWFGPGERTAALRSHLLAAVGTAEREGLKSSSYMPGVLQFGDTMGAHATDSMRLKDWDRCFTEAALALGRDFCQGTGNEKMVSYDGVSGRYENRDETSIVNGLVGVRSAEDLNCWLNSLLPVSHEYSLLRDSLAGCRAAAHEYWSSGSLAALAIECIGMERLTQAMNAYRWMHHFNFDGMIVVNIPSADLRYYRSDKLLLQMKVVAGQPSKRTPRFAAWCDGLVLYPYWNVPPKIVVNELLPLFKRAPDLAGSMEMQIVDNRGRSLDPAKIAWASYTPKTFPYRIRQAPGCFNALGVLKFNITSPYDVYMHDTNLKSAFQSAHRYYSHGCIRLERPIELGRALLHDRLDTTFLLSCFRNQKPKPITLDKPVPVFVVYNKVGIDISGKLAWYKNVYHLED